MPTFEYEVVDRAGAIGRGRLQADDHNEAVQRFRKQGQLVVSLRATTDQASGSVADALRGSIAMATRRGVRLGTLVLFTGQLAAMLDAGIHLVRILTALGRELTDRRFARVIDDVQKSLTEGASFADALARYPRIFNTLYVAVVRAGEVSGTLPIVLDTLTVYLEKTAHLRRRVRGAIAYPAVILVTAVLIVVVMILKIVPVFEDVYTRANAKLPPPTLVLIGISHAFRDYTVLALAALGALGILVYFAARTETGRDVLDALKLRVPIFGTLIRKAIMARVCRTMGLLLQSGLPLMDVLDTVTRVAGNRVIEKAVAMTMQRVRDGATLADALRDTGQFPGMITQLVASGEESGSLASMLGKAAGYYEQQVDNMVSTLATLIEPIMIVVMGGIVGSVIVALYLPIFSLGQAIKGGLK